MANKTPNNVPHVPNCLSEAINYIDSNSSSITMPSDIIRVNKAVDDEIVPIIDYSLLFSNDPEKRSNSLRYLSHVCQDYGFFNLVNHGVSHSVFENVLKGISDFFDPTDVDGRRPYQGKNPTDRIRWGLSSSLEENREYLKVAVHPEFHCPPKPAHFSVALEDYSKRLQEVELGLAKAMSRVLGFEECYIENALNLKSGFDVFVTNLYPPNFKSEGSMGLADHTDPGLFVSLIQDVNGGLQVLSHDGKWADVNMPPSSIFIIFSDHLEILTNGKCKSTVHRVVVGDNKVKRISASTLHGPSLEAFVKPAMVFLDDCHPPGYRGMTYKQYLEATGFHEVDVKSCLQQVLVPNNEKNKCYLVD